MTACPIKFTFSVSIVLYPSSFLDIHEISNDRFGGPMEAYTFGNDGIPNVRLIGVHIHESQIARYLEEKYCQTLLHPTNLFEKHIP